jgi:phosphate starvation-inducible PhoH-like protein
MSKTRKVKRKTDTDSTKNETKLYLKEVIGNIYFKSKNNKQKELYDLIDEKEIVICSGPAGVGKSYITALKSLKLLSEPNNEYYKIIITTPAVEADEKLGFLPGDMLEKMSPYVFSTIYLLEKIIGKEAVKELRNKNHIQIMPLAYMRGINVDNAILLAEEFQNSTKRQTKTLLTRIGHNSKFIISGDLKQSDRYKNESDTGLYDALHRLDSISEVGIIEFEESEIVRNRVISKILDKYKDED